MQYLDFDLMKRLNQAAGRHYFDNDTMKFFKSRLLDCKVNGVFIESIKAGFTSSERIYKVCKFDIETGKVSNLKKFDSLYQARKFFKSL